MMVHIHDKFVIRANEYINNYITENKHKSSFKINLYNVYISSKEIYHLLSTTKKLQYPEISDMLIHFRPGWDNGEIILEIFYGNITELYVEKIDRDLCGRVVALSMQQGWDPRDQKEIVSEIRKLEDELERCKKKLERYARSAESLACADF